MTFLIHARAAGTSEMLAVLGDEALLRNACRFEAALARAQAAEGLMTKAEADAIAAACAQPLDIAALAEEAAFAGTLAIALVRRLRADLGDNAATGKLHLGATSQDVADTILALQAKAATTIILRDLDRLSGALARLAKKHAATPMPGRTLLQPALPITFGFKVANWLLGIDAASARLRRESGNACALQFGGATGTLAGLNGRGPAVARRLAEELGLFLPVLSWHARRDAMAGLAAALAIQIGALAKMARDISLMSQAEIGEAFEPRQEDRGGSSIMANKQNATGCQTALSAALRAPGLAMTVIAGMPQEHERGLGGWQAEAPVMADLFILAHGALATMLPVAEGLTVDSAAMLRNLEAAGMGQDFAEAKNLTELCLEQRGKID